MNKKSATSPCPINKCKQLQEQHAQALVPFTGAYLSRQPFFPLRTNTVILGKPDRSPVLLQKEARRMFLDTGSLKTYDFWHYGEEGKWVICELKTMFEVSGLYRSF